jgi:hypothetical protein
VTGVVQLTPSTGGRVARKWRQPSMPWKIPAQYPHSEQYGSWSSSSSVPSVAAARITEMRPNSADTWPSAAAWS